MTDTIAIAALIGDKKLLQGHRHPGNAGTPDCPDLVGGHVELGESPEQAARRECGEEIGVELVGLRPVEVQLSTPELVPHASSDPAGRTGDQRRARRARRPRKVHEPRSSAAPAG